MMLMAPAIMPMPLPRRFAATLPFRHILSRFDICFRYYFEALPPLLPRSAFFFFFQHAAMFYAAAAAAGRWLSAAEEDICRYAQQAHGGDERAR